MTKNRGIEHPIKKSAELGSLMEWAVPERAVDVLRFFADTPAPSQTASWTKGPGVKSIIDGWELKNYSWDPNFKGTGTGLLTIGNRKDAPVWIVAHWDVISFLIKEKNESGYLLTPFHHHLMKSGSQPGRVLRYDLPQEKYRVVSTGKIHGGEFPAYQPDEPVELRPGDRVVYHTPMQEKENHICTGQMDNAPGCAGALMAGAILSKLPGVSVHICFVDEEEGPVAVGSTSFSRGSRRLLRFLPPPDLAIVVDHHTVSKGDENPHMGNGALYKEQASDTRGGVTPPWLYETVRSLAEIYSPNVQLNENRYANVSRSDCVSLMKVTPNIVLCGPPTVGRHYVDGLYKCSVFDVAHLARSLAMIAYHLQK